jgi:hypothetical protein
VLENFSEIFDRNSENNEGVIYIFKFIATKRVTNELIIEEDLFLDMA